MLKYIFITCVFTFSIKCLTQENFQLIDLSQVQIRVINSIKHSSTEEKRLLNQFILDSLYTPHQQFWNGYLGNGSQLVSWMNEEAINSLELLNRRNDSIKGKLLFQTFNEVNKGMKKLTGYTISGKWYMVYCHGATNLGGLSTGEMVIDLANDENNSYENIIQWFPHEMTHSIMNTVNTHTDTTAMGTIINEGFATYVNELYWGKRYTPAQNLGYTEKEYRNCLKFQRSIKKYFDHNKFSTDPKIINTFRSRSIKIRKELPGAIGYYCGYQIIKKYALKSSWLDVFHKNPIVIYNLAVH